MKNDDIKTVTISAVGDICLGLGVRDKIKKHGNDFVLSNVIEELRKSDLMMGNLEVVFPGSHKSIQNGQSDIWAPDSAFPVIAVAHFDVLNLSNNHIMDFGVEGLSNTLKLLDDNGILHVGAHKNLDMAREPLIVECNSLVVGFLSYADDEGQIAGRCRPGVVEVRRKHVLKDVALLKEKVDVIILTLHMGIEFIHYPSPFIVDLARSAVSAGADVVLCHHPHVLRGMEVYEKSLICYSLGNFVFQVHDDDYQCKFLPYTAWSTIVKLDLSKDGYQSHEIIPVVIKGDYRPWIANGTEKQMITKHIDKISKPLYDRTQINILYYNACLRYAKVNYWRMLSLIRSKDIKSIITLLSVMVSRAPNRRWILGFLRYMFSRVFSILCRKNVNVYSD